MNSIKTRFDKDLEGLIPQAYRAFHRFGWLLDYSNFEDQEEESEEEIVSRWRIANKRRANEVLEPVWQLMNDACKASLDFNDVCHGFLEFTISIHNSGNASSIGKLLFVKCYLNLSLNGNVI